jgi:hypothetical protein
MKRILAVMAIVGISLLSFSVLAGVTVRVENKDSKEYTAKAVCHGTKYDVKIGKGTTSVTIQGSAPCEVSLGGSKLTLSGGERVIIKNGKMSK